MRAVCVVIISKLRIQQILFCLDARKERQNKQHCEKHTDSRTKSQAPSQWVDKQAKITGVTDNSVDASGYQSMPRLDRDEAAESVA